MLTSPYVYNKRKITSRCFASGALPDPSRFIPSILLTRDVALLQPGLRRLKMTSKGNHRFRFQVGGGIQTGCDSHKCFICLTKHPTHADRQYWNLRESLLPIYHCLCRSDKSLLQLPDTHLGSCCPFLLSP